MAARSATRIMDMGAPDEALDRPARNIRPRARRSFASALSVGLSAAGILAASACVTPAWSDASIKYCARATAKMPSAQQHRSWLAQNHRYGPDAAAEFAKLAARFGDRYLNYQILFHEDFGASAWFDVEGYNGLHEAEVKNIKRWKCLDGEKSYPLVLMVGVQAERIRQGALYVSAKRGVYHVMSLRSLRHRKIIPVRLSGSGEVLCRNIRSCVGLAAHPGFR
jgi:hypothetical protein